jgi:hypothetical protein
MANSKLHDDLVNEIEPQNNADDSIKALCLAIADRIEACHGSAVKLTDLATVLRENPEAVGAAALANTPVAKVNVTRTTSGVEAPSAAFELPRENVRDGSGASTNDHRDQQFPPNENTEPEREQIKREQVARDRGATLAVNVDLPDVPEADRKEDERRKGEIEKMQRGKKEPRGKKSAKKAGKKKAGKKKAAKKK